MCRLSQQTSFSEEEPRYSDARCLPVLSPPREVSRTHVGKAVVGRPHGQVRTLGGAGGHPESRCGGQSRLLGKLVACEAMMLILLLPLINLNLHIH